MALTLQGKEAILVPLVILGLTLWCLSGCAARPFQEDGVTFVPTTREFINTHKATGLQYEPVALAYPTTKTVFILAQYEDDSVLKAHEKKHLIPDRDSPTGYCQHLTDGTTWIHKICQGE